MTIIISKFLSADMLQDLITFENPAAKFWIFEYAMFLVTFKISWVNVTPNGQKLNSKFNSIGLSNVIQFDSLI